jgi:hypothetical protein
MAAAEILGVLDLRQRIASSASAVAEVVAARLEEWLAYLLDAYANRSRRHSCRPSHDGDSAMPHRHRLSCCK